MSVQSINHPVRLSNEEKVGQGYNQTVKLTYLDVRSQTATATALTVILLGLLAGYVIKNIAWELITPFADGADTGNNTTTLLLQHGSSSLIAATETNLNGTTVSRARSDTAVAITTTENLQAVFGAPASGKTLAALTQGEVHIFFTLEQPSRLG